MSMYMDIQTLLICIWIRIYRYMLGHVYSSNYLFLFGLRFWNVFCLFFWLGVDRVGARRPNYWKHQLISTLYLQAKE